MFREKRRRRSLVSAGKLIHCKATRRQRCLPITDGMSERKGEEGRKREGGGNLDVIHNMQSCIHVAK